MTGICPAGRLLHALQDPHKAFVIVELCQPAPIGKIQENLK
jgi:hypothetical protein